MNSIFRVVLLLFLFLSNFALYAQTEEQKKPVSEFEKHRQIAAEHYEKKDWKNYLTELENLLKLANTKEEKIFTNSLLGMYYVGQKEYKKAIPYFEEVLKLDEKNLEAIETLGDIYQSNEYGANLEEKIKKSLPLLLKAEQLNTSSSGTYYGIACIYSLNKEEEKAIQYLDKAIYNGYDNIDWIQKDSDLENIRKTEYYIRLVKNWEKIKFGRDAISEGRKANDASNYDLAIHNFLKANELFTTALGNNSLLVSSPSIWTGSVYDSKGEYDKAIDYYNKSLAIRLKILGGEHPYVATSYYNIGLAYQSKGEYDNAIEYYQKSLIIRIKTLRENHQDIATIYSSLGLAYKSKGEYEKSIEFNQKSLSIQLKTLGENHPNTATSYNNIGVVYFLKNESKKAIDFFKKSLDINLIIHKKNHLNIANAYDNIGRSYLTLEQNNKALDLFEKSLSIRLSNIGENDPNIDTTYRNIGLAYSNKKEYSKAIKYFSKSLDLCMITYGQNHPYTATSYNNLGTVYNSKKEYDKAIDYHQKAIAILEKSGDRFGHVISYLLLRDVYDAQKNTDMKIFALTQAMELVLKYRQEMGRDKEFFTKHFLPVFEELVKVYTDSEQFDKAMEITEKMRGLSLSESFNLKYALTNGGVPKEKADMILNLKKEIEGLFSQRITALQKTDDVSKALSDRLWNEISAKEKELNELDKELMQKPIYAKLRKLSSPSIIDLQNLLGKTKKTFLEYDLIRTDGKEELHVFVITPERFKHINLGKDLDLTRKINNLRKIISTYPKKGDRKFIVLKDKEGKEILCTFAECKLFKKGQEHYVQELDLKNSEPGKMRYIQKLVGKHDRRMELEEANAMMDSLLKEIYALTIKPIEKAGLLKTKSIVISPDSTLFTIPFSALKNEKDEYAVETYEISIIHSASIWERLIRKEELKFTLPLFAMGHSVYAPGHSDSRGVSGMRGLLLDESGKPISRQTRSAKYLDEIRMSNLPGSLEEIKEISKLAYGKETEEDHIYLGIRANKEELYKKFDTSSSPLRDVSHGEGSGVRYRIVHFSVHGLFFMDSPDMNSLAFTSREKAIKYRNEDLLAYEKKNGEIKKDGFFKLGETIELAIKTDLLVMSACETSLGTEKAGEGMVGLPQGFLMGGANNVLATLWSVDDKGTMRFMKEFYTTHLAKKTNAPSSTLRTTQKKLAKKSKDDKYIDPFYWSPFVVYGK